ncbi:2-amino-3-ketobutyrate coenzyme A ligase [subsurface metagenome]
MENTRMFRKGLEDAGYTIVPGTHPIVPVMPGHLPDDAKLSQEPAGELLDNGKYVTQQGLNPFKNIVNKLIDEKMNIQYPTRNLTK